MSEGPLAGIRVMEFSDAIGPAYCGKLMADYGARMPRRPSIEGFLARVVQHLGMEPDVACTDSRPLQSVSPICFVGV